MVLLLLQYERLFIPLKSPKVCYITLVGSLVLLNGPFGDSVDGGVGVGGDETSLKVVLLGG